MAEAVLDVRGVSAGYGPVDVLRDIALDVPEGAVVALLGANGAGKTTLLRSVCGIVPARGSITFRGESITNLPTASIVRRGIGHVPEGRGTLMGMTVRENLLVGAYTTDAATTRANLERVEGYFPFLADRHAQRAGLLSGGEQQMLAIGRALMSAPELLLVDELSLGLAPKIAHGIVQSIRRLSEETGLSVLLVEQNANLALRVAERAYVLNLGEIVMQGTREELLASDDMRRAYLGY